MYVEVIITLPIFTTFYYYSEQSLQVGEYVLVPFGHGSNIGLVINTFPTCEMKEIKNITEVINIPQVSAHFIKFIKWVAQYNIIPCGTIFKLSLSGIKTGEEYYQISKTEQISKYQKIALKLQGHSMLSAIEMCKIANIRPTTLIKLLEQQVIRTADISQINNENIECSINLSEEQRKALSIISLYYHRYQALLLEGVTGSGKTEVYFSAIANILQQDANAQALILLPEIILTSQVSQRLQRYFSKVNIVEWHSTLSNTQRKINWWKIVTGQAQIIIGARSALFLQYKKLKIIIVDEEHDSSFKSNHGQVNYHARDMAIIRAKEEKIPIILSSATPSLESFYNAQVGKFIHIFLSKRYGDFNLPAITLIDMKKNKSKNWISEELYSAIRNQLYQGQQVLLFLNRRGYTPLTLCKECGERLQCINCSSWLVKHNIHQAFVCHYCAYKVKIFNECSKCGVIDSFVSYGPGIERIEEEVKLQIPSARIALMSSDTKHNDRMIADILSKKIDIIIGTQVIAKGHHFPHLNLVGVVDADASLYGGDLRSAERTYQILQQVAGRAGRESDEGQVMLQSYSPESIKAVYENKNFRINELQSRQKNNMPPFSRISTLTISHPQHHKVQSISNDIAKALRHNQVKMLGPMPANIYLLKKKYIYKIILTAERHFNIQSHIQKCQLLNKYRKIINVDVDSMDFL